MFDQSLKVVMKENRKKFITASPADSVNAAAKLMRTKGLVVEDAKPVGIVSSRDAMDPDMQECIWQERQRAHHR